MTSATEELRRMLDERGEEHYDATEGTLWLKDGVGYRACADEGLNGLVHLSLWCTTPAQAVDATLGRGTCRMELEPGSDRLWWCSSCQSYHEHESKYPWEFCPRCGAKVMKK